MYPVSPTGAGGSGLAATHFAEPEVAATRGASTERPKTPTRGALPTRPQSFDDRTLVMASSIAAMEPKVHDFASSLRLGFLDRVREFFGQHTAAGDVLRAAKSLDDCVGCLCGDVVGTGVTFKEASSLGVERLAEQVCDAAMNLTAKIAAWRERNPDDTNRSADAFSREMTGLIGRLAAGMTDREMMDAFFARPLPEGFPLAALPRLQAMLLDHTAALAVGQAPHGSFLRGNETAAYVSVVKAEVRQHFAGAIASTREALRSHGLAELARNPRMAGEDRSEWWRNADMRAALVRDYQAMITSLLGRSPESARRAAADFPETTIAKIRHVKDALSSAAQEKRITGEQAARAVRLLVVDNVFLRSVNAAFIESYGHADSATNSFLGTRAAQVCSLGQMQANGIELNGDESKLARGDPRRQLDLAAEKAKLDAFIQAVIDRL